MQGVTQDAPGHGRVAVDLPCQQSRVCRHWRKMGNTTHVAFLLPCLGSFRLHLTTMLGLLDELVSARDSLCLSETMRDAVLYIESALAYIDTYSIYIAS